ncbi:MAG TPA: ABC transporter ATP-binding protein [Hypericibacter adhaerens]|uniref:ABC transporter ATP-binding protein n=1 Tax=Hypericibacter adhaerens TaxID=2602016 RepID=UPI002B813710|nr:ABC transporter ATP-binding protein [Hypericibacter adhaerens]HWA44135.1 ABC transporter ATP-binding protein [Hypericibacter adhaerens]
MAAVTGAPSVLLATRGLGRRFGGLRAVDAVDLTVERGEIRAVIGPNGAGKTTLVGMICGRIAASEGQVLFEGEDITGLRPWSRVERGIAYTFQITSIFQNLTCFDNVALAAQRGLPCRGGEAELAQKVERTLARVGLAGRGTVLASTLPYGHQRLLEVAIGLALAPKLLILDEPTQGLSEEEIVGFCALVREIAADATVLLIEHNMPVVMDLSHRITVMDNGRVLAEGTPEEIQANPEVRRAYLGT